MGSLTLIGSAETSPGMVKVHRNILDGQPANPRVVYIDTPHGFQENVQQITDKIEEFFTVSLKQPLLVASLQDSQLATPAEIESFRSIIESADYLFTGPGSPSYAIAHWQAVEAGRSMALASAHGAAITLASAAAVTAGRYAIPVYEIYKVGTPPFWLDGMDLVGSLVGIEAVVVPHWDNRDGTNHDTRRCYIGQRRLDDLMAQLPTSVPIIGIDEHTAVTFQDEHVYVQGIGQLTVRSGDEERVLPAGASSTVSDLFEAPLRSAPAPAADRPPDSFEQAVTAGDSIAAADAILADLTREDFEQVRRNIVDLARIAQTGIQDPVRFVEPFVEILMQARARARSRHDFAEADHLRDALIAAGIEIHDGSDASTWQLAP